MRITSKGRITLPAKIREQAGFLPNTEIEICVSGNDVVLRKAVKFTPCRGLRLIALMRGRGTRHMDTDGVMALTRG